MAAYAVDALDDQERAAYEAHLADCPECREELARLSDATAFPGRDCGGDAAARAQGGAS